MSVGAKVIGPGRDTEKAKRNLEGTANVELETMDLMNHFPLILFLKNCCFRQGTSLYDQQCGYNVGAFGKGQFLVCFLNLLLVWHLTTDFVVIKTSSL